LIAFELNGGAMGPHFRLKPVEQVEECGCVQFLDDQDQSEDRKQPWRAFWPPASMNEDCGIWAKSEFPEATSWKFDSKTPFDRPWRTWTRTAIAKSEICNAPRDYQDMIDKGIIQPVHGSSEFDRNV
jgi:hypothetical protein